MTNCTDIVKSMARDRKKVSGKHKRLRSQLNKKDRQGWTRRRKSSGVKKKREIGNKSC